MRRGAIGAAAVGTLALGLSGPCLVDCRQIAGVHELTAASAVCASCADAQCAGAESVCHAADPACDVRIACELGCDPDDLACRATCMTAPVGDAIGTFDACAETTCASWCASQCGDVLPVVPAGSGPGCATCVAQTCCAQASACGTSAECRAGLECARAASVPDAVITCSGARHPAGTAAFDALAACVAASCPDACAYGADWSCLDAAKLPVATADSVQGTLIVVDATAQNEGVPGLSVRGCTLTDEQCANPVTPTATTDATGAVTVTVPTSQQLGRTGFLGYFEITDPTGTYLTTLAIPGFSITQPGFTQSLIATPVAALQSLFGEVGKPYDPTTGGAIVTAVDCDDHPSAGATFSLDNADTATIIAYPIDGIPSLNTTHTDSTGTAVIVYLPPGPGVITTTNAAGQVVSKTSYFTRANSESVVLSPANQ